MPGSQTTPNRTNTCDVASVRVAFHVKDRVGVRDRNHFRGSMAGLCVPRSTLRRRPRGRLRMTQGHRGSLLLQCCGLSPLAPRRFRRRTFDSILSRSRMRLPRGGTTKDLIEEENSAAGVQRL